MATEATEENGLERKEASTCPGRYNLRNEEGMHMIGSHGHTCFYMDTHTHTHFGLE